MSYSNYPAGAEFDPRAPWNEPEPEIHEFEVTATTTLVAYSEIETDKAFTEYDEDEDGGYSFLNTENVDFQNEFEKQYRTPIQLLAMLKEMCFEKMKTETDKSKISELQSIIDDCNIWQEENFEVEGQ